MALLGSEHGYFVVWTPKGVWYELIEFDLKLWNDVALHLEIFFQKFILKHLLQMESFTYCAFCNRLLLPHGEFCESDENNEASICCVSCCLSFHCQCVQVVDIHNDNWLCDSFFKFVKAAQIIIISL